MFLCVFPIPTHNRWLRTPNNPGLSPSRAKRSRPDQHSPSKVTLWLNLHSKRPRHLAPTTIHYFTQHNRVLCVKRIPTDQASVDDSALTSVSAVQVATVQGIGKVGNPPKKSTYWAGHNQNSAAFENVKGGVQEVCGGAPTKRRSDESGIRAWH